MSPVIDKIVHLSEERVKRLEQLASNTGTTEDALIEKALDILFTLSGSNSAEEDRNAWGALSLKSFERVWENEADSVYDNWRELYGISER